MAKFKVGDKVEIIKAHVFDGSVVAEIPPVGTIAVIEEVDDYFCDDFIYSIDCDKEFVYSEEMLKLYSEDGTEAFLVHYYVDEGKIVLYDSGRKKLYEEIYVGIPSRNEYLSGFFSGLGFMDKKFTVKCDYIRTLPESFYT